MENENNEGIRRVSRQSWKPAKPLRVLHGSWNAVYTFMKILLGALATVLAITVVSLFAIVG